MRAPRCPITDVLVLVERTVASVGRRVKPRRPPRSAVPTSTGRAALARGLVVDDAAVFPPGTAPVAEARAPPPGAPAPRGTSAVVGPFLAARARGCGELLDGLGRRGPAMPSRSTSRWSPTPAWSRPGRGARRPARRRPGPARRASRWRCRPTAALGRRGAAPCSTPSTSRCRPPWRSPAPRAGRRARRDRRRRRRAGEVPHRRARRPRSVPDRRRARRLSSRPLSTRRVPRSSSPPGCTTPVRHHDRGGRRASTASSTCSRPRPPRSTARATPRRWRRCSTSASRRPCWPAGRRRPGRAAPAVHLVRLVLGQRAARRPARSRMLVEVEC